MCVKCPVILGVMSMNFRQKQTGNSHLVVHLFILFLLSELMLIHKSEHMNTDRKTSSYDFFSDLVIFVVEIIIYCFPFQ